MRHDTRALAVALLEGMSPRDAIATTGVTPARAGAILRGWWRRGWYTANGSEHGRLTEWGRRALMAALGTAVRTADARRSTAPDDTEGHA